MIQQIFGTFSSTKFHENSPSVRELFHAYRRSERHTCKRRAACLRKRLKRVLSKYQHMSVFMWLQIGSIEDLVQTWCWPQTVLCYIENNALKPALIPCICSVQVLVEGDCLPAPIDPAY
jgi:hypothetical protein